MFHGGGAYRHHAIHASRTRTRTHTRACISRNNQLQYYNINKHLSVHKAKKQQSESKTCSSSAFFMFTNAGKKKHWSKNVHFLLLFRFFNPHNAFSLLDKIKHKCGTVRLQHATYRDHYSQKGQYVTIENSLNTVNETSSSSQPALARSNVALYS